MSRRLFHSRQRHRAARSVLGSTALSLSLGVGAQAQDVMAPEPLQGPVPRVWFEPRFTLGMGVRHTGSRADPRARTEERIEFSPGISGAVHTPRLQGTLDYELASEVYPQDDDKGRISHHLEAQGTVNAWNNRAFVDLAASVRQRAISLFDDPGLRRSREQTAQSTWLQVAPRLSGRLGRLADYQLRYSAQGLNMGSDELPGLSAQTASAQLASPRSAARLGWLLEADTQAVRYDSGRDTRSDSAQVGLVLRPMDTLSLTATRGRETNDILTLQRTAYDTRGLQLDWRPGPRTRVQAGGQDRYFGRGHSLSLQHSTARTVWRYTDSKGVSSGGLEASAAPLGTLRQLVEGHVRLNNPGLDETALQRLIHEQLRELNVPGDLLVFMPFLSSSALLERSKRLSVALVGVRSTVTVAYLRNDLRRLAGPLGDAAPLLDDVATNSHIQQKGWSLHLAHRLTPRSTASVGVTRRHSVGDVDRRLTRALDLGLVSRLGQRTDAAVNLTLARHSGNFRPYHDTGLSAQIVHRF